MDGRPELLAKAVPLEPSVFLMGGSLALLSPEVRARAESRRTPLSSLLAPVPPHWVRLPGFAVAPALVTNGEYRAFLRETRGKLYDAPELWRYVWGGLGAALERQTTWLVRSSGPPAALVERYDRFESFVEAWLESLRLEAQRLLAGPDAPLEPVLAVAPPGRIVVRLVGDEGESLATLPQEPAVDAVFEAMAGRLSAYPAERADGGTRRMSRRLLDPGALDVLIARLEGVARAAATSSLARPADPESLVVLSRLRAALDRGHDVVPLHEVLYPRTWHSPGGEPESPFAASPGLPWAERPLHGVSLHEALAFCLWLSERARPGEVVTLPNEAEWERAASWPDAPADAGEPLDPARKDLFPWSSSGPATGGRDFHDFFGGGARDLGRYAASRSEWARVVEATSRRTSRGKRIDQLLGFGWQWTLERFDDDERGYGRFADGTCPFAFERPLAGRKGGDTSARVHDYAANRAARHGYYVLRGAPDLIGGQGVTPRRFAANPLRGHPNVGFRWIVRRA